MNCFRANLVGVATLMAISFARGDTLTSGRQLRIIPARPPIAQPFDLHEVLLLDGEFKTGQEIAAKYLLSVDADRLLSGFRTEAGLAPKGKNYGGWESKSIAGHTLGHYLSGCSLAWASTGDERFLERVNYIVGQLAECQKAGGDGYLAAFAGGRKAFEEIAAGKIRSSGFDLNGLWVPNYTEHKVFAGLRDAYRLAGNTIALRVARDLADYYDRIFSGLSEEQMQQVLACEHGGLNEVLADLYADTGEVRYLELSRQFHHKAILEPLARGEDILPGKHANTQIPKLAGLATRYELAGDLNDRWAAEFFWERVVHHHSYVTGGHSDSEHFGAADRLNDRLSTKTTETCNVNNMLKLTEHVFGWNPEAAVADFYERALLNHIRSTQHPDGRVMYFLALKPGYHKEYQRPYDDWTCCVGTGMENHVKYGAGIYYHSQDTLWVNLFIASAVNWKERGIGLRQESGWPESEHSMLTLRTQKPQRLKLRIRHPFWADKLTVKVNGRMVSDTTSPSSYAVIEREWKNGDRVEVQFPMRLRLETMPDNASRAAVFYGPILLAGNLGEVKAKMASKEEIVPVLVTENRPVKEWVKPLNVERQIFGTLGVGKPHDVEFVPLHKLHDRSYTVYFELFTAQKWAEREEEFRAAERRQKALQARTVDFFQPGEMQPEREHQVAGEKSDAGELNGRKFRHAFDGGWFSFHMRADADMTNELVCTWWRDETGPRDFDVFANDVKIASQQLARNQPGRFWEATYVIPNEVTRGKREVVVKLQAKPGNLAGGLFGCRMVRAE